MFYNTQQALDFGLQADSFDLMRLRDLRDLYLSHAEAAKRRQRWNLAIMMATQAQFCREALEAATILDGWDEQFEGLDKWFDKDSTEDVFTRAE